MLTPDEVKKIAKLASLPIAEPEIEKFVSQLSEILDYFKQLERVDTKNVVPTFNTTGTANVFREDVPQPSLTQDQALQNAPLKKDGYFVTKGVFSNE